MLDGQIAQARAQCLGPFAGVVGVAAIQQQGEFLATQAYRHVQRPARGILEQEGHALQGLVAGLVAIAVVVALEVIDIAQQHRHRLALALALPPQGVQMAVEAAPIVQAGQAVAVGQLAQQATNEELFAGLVFELVATGGADQVAEQQVQQLRKQIGLGADGQLQPGVDEHDAQRYTDRLGQAHAGEKIAAQADEQQTFGGIAGIDPLGQHHHHRGAHAHAQHAHQRERAEQAAVTPLQHQGDAGQQQHQHGGAHPDHPPEHRRRDEAEIQGALHQQDQHAEE